MQLNVQNIPQANDNSPNNSQSPDLLLSQTQTFSSKKDFLTNLEHAFHNEEISVHYTPDRLFDLFDFQIEAPTVEFAIHHNFIVNYPMFRTAVQDISVTQWGGPIRPFPGLQPEYYEVPYKHKLDSHQLADRQNLVSTLQSPNPTNLWNQDFHARITRLATLWQNRIPDLQYTTYHYISLYKVLAGATVHVLAGGVNYSTIGLETLVQQMSNNSAFLQPYYPMVWDGNYAAGSLTNMSLMAEWIHLRFNTTPLFVFVDLMQHGAALVGRVTVAGAAVPDLDRLYAMLAYTTEIDRKMMLIGAPIPYIATDDEGHEHPRETRVLIPEYNFYNHLLDIASMNMQPQRWTLYENDVWRNVNHHCVLLMYIQNIMYQRVQEYVGQAFLSEYPRHMDNRHFIYFNAAAFPLRSNKLRLGFWCPYEILTTIQARPLLSEFYKVTDARPVKGLGPAVKEYLTIARQVKDDRIFFNPSLIGSSQNDDEPLIAPASNRPIFSRMPAWMGLLPYGGGQIPFFQFITNAFGQTGYVIPAFDIIELYNTANVVTQTPGLRPGRDYYLIDHASVTPFHTNKMGQIMCENMTYLSEYALDTQNDFFQL